MKVKNIKIQQFIIPAKKAGTTFSFSSITVEEPNTCSTRTQNTRIVSMISGNHYSFTTPTTCSRTVLPFIFYRCWQRKKKIEINTMEEEKNEEKNWGL